MTTYTTDFRIVVKKDSECILVDESITGITVNETKLHSMENQKVIAAAGYYLSKPKCEMMLLPERPNLVQIGWNGLKLTLYVPGDPERTVQGVNTGQLSAPGRGDGWLRWGGFSEDWCFMAGFRQRKVRRKRDSLLRAMDSYW